ncbi:MAG: hypothetical protein IJC59_01640 [Lachnospiraceae bacterium]|nr:hypothetical protein [Lachnospiraceae bacterium]
MENTQNTQNTGERDTIRLLRECDAGSKMAVSSIDEVMDKISDPAMKKLLKESKDHHSKLGNELHELLNRHESEEKDPSLMAKGMSRIMTNVKISMDNCDATIADLMTDGCNMGIKSLYRYLNQYKAADKSARDICKRLISIEEALCKKLTDYL